MASANRRIGRRFVDGLKFRSMSMLPATVGHSVPFSHQRRAASTETSMAIVSSPTHPWTVPETVCHAASQTTAESSPQGGALWANNDVPTTCQEDSCKKNRHASCPGLSSLRHSIAWPATVSPSTHVGLQQILD